MVSHAQDLSSAFKPSKLVHTHRSSGQPFEPLLCELLHLICDISLLQHLKPMFNCSNTANTNLPREIKEVIQLLHHNKMGFLRIMRIKMVNALY